MGNNFTYTLTSSLILLILFNSIFTLIPFFNDLGIQYLDEVLLLYTLVIILFRKKKNKLETIVLFALLYFILISIIQNSSSVLNIIFQSVIHLKFILFTIYIDKKFSSNNLKKLLKFIFLITFIGILINLVLQDTFNQLFDAIVHYRSGFSRIVGFQLSPNNLGFTIIMFFIFIIHKVRYVRLLLIYTISTIGLLFLTGSRTSILSVLIIFGLWFTLQGRVEKLKYIALIVIITPILGYFLVDLELYNITLANLEHANDADESGNIRLIMMYYAIKILFMYFPFGSGSATFGTVTSSGSYVYDVFGLSSMRFFKETSGIYDSNWASVIGEFGFVGLVIFCVIFYRLYKYTNMNRKNLYKLPVLSVVLVFLISGITMPVMMNGYTSMLFALLLVYFKKK